MNRREFLQVLAAGRRGGLSARFAQRARQGRAGAAMYDVAPFGNVSLLHFTDCHAQLLPTFSRAERQSRIRPCAGPPAASRRRSAAEALRHHAENDRTPMRSRISISRQRPETYGRSAASRTSQRSSSS
jgi:2',3'-cyclic-nucleotide 2'-phosphodiesterase (5'-nucleotidase family)